MTPVQHKVLSELPSYQSDALVQAKTGTGKTIAFLLPTLHSLLARNDVPKGQVAVLIMSPTRELALQIAKECDAVTSQLRPALECHTAYGGTSKDRDLRKFLAGDPKIVVATPGRLNDYLSDNFVAEKFAHIRTLILDEADTMLEAGFLKAINDILRRLPPKATGWQGLCFSATMPSKINEVLPKVLKTGHTRLSTIDPNDRDLTIDRVQQHSVIAPSVKELYTTLYALLLHEYQLQPNNYKTIVFGITANGVALMHALFANLFHGEIQISQLHSRLSQAARTRTTNEFKEAKAGIMFASDVIGRGMDFPNVSLVVQVGLPSNGEQYVHRVGRTARAGNEGRAVILLTPREAFFLKVNKHLPITPYPSTSLDAAAASTAPNVEAAFARVDDPVKHKAYQAWLGFHKTFTRQLQLTNEGLVEAANEYAEALGCPEPPMIDKQIVGKMGLKGVRGLNVGHVERTGGGGRRGGGGGGGGGGRAPPQQNSSGSNHCIRALAPRFSLLAPLSFIERGVCQGPLLRADVIGVDAGSLPQPLAAVLAGVAALAGDAEGAAAQAVVDAAEDDAGGALLDVIRATVAHLQRGGHAEGVVQCARRVGVDGEQGRGALLIARDAGRSTAADDGELRGGLVGEEGGRG
nr:atp-dependent rna helicase, mitochondrial [Quercus suber]